MIKESMIDPSPFTPDDVISHYHDRSVWGEQRKEPRPRALSNNKTLENLYRVQQLYYDIMELVDDKIREKYGHDEKNLKEVRLKMQNRADNKVRSDNQGQLFVQIGRLYYTGSAKEYEKYFNSTKKAFNSVLKEISKELSDTINDKAFAEDGKPLKLDQLQEKK